MSEEDISFKNRYCCNPFEKTGHKTLKNLRSVQIWMCELKPSIKPDAKICNACRKQLSVEKSQSQRKCDYANCEEFNEEKDNPLDTSFSDPNTSIEYLNKSLEYIEESPIVKKRIKNDPAYCKRKLDRVTKNLTKKLFDKNEEQDDDDDDKDDAHSEIVIQLKEKFMQTESMSEKFLILTVLPQSWTIGKIEKEFHVSNRMARKAKALVKEKGILSTPDPKAGKSLKEVAKQKVLAFYNSDEVSRIMPGKKDYVSMKTKDGKKPEHVQKRLILGNLKEIYDLFKTENSQEKIGFSKFAELRPKNCVLAGGSGTHTVCVCTIHQNVKLMLSGNFFKEMVMHDGSHFDNYTSCLEKIMCAPPSPDCHLDKCKNCPGTRCLENQLLNAFEEKMIENITYKQWISVDRCSFETVIKTYDDFASTFCEKLLYLKKHSFIAKQQSAYFSRLKENVQVNEAVITLDFSENYSFVVQDEAQSFHWTKDQATVHPFAVYYRDQDEVKYKSFVFISDCLLHNTVAVHLFQKKLINFLKENVLPSLEKIFYFSDGSASQYKNRKNFSNICLHQNDFNIHAEWHFYATAHGKGVCDGLGGTVKRLAAKASLQKLYSEQILTPVDLYNWCVLNIPSIQFFYTTVQDYSEEEELLKSRFSRALPIEGTQKFHSFIPLNECEITTKMYSNANEFEKHKIFEECSNFLSLADLKGYITCEYDKKWWLAEIISKDVQNKKVTVNFLHPSGPAPSFVYPQQKDILSVSVNQILTCVDPRTPTGRTYYLSEKEMSEATSMMKRRYSLK